MNWIDFGIIPQNLFYGMVTSSAAGSFLVILILLLELSEKFRNSRLKLPWIKIAQLLFLLPVATIFVIYTRALTDGAELAWSSDFWRVSTVPMRKFYAVLTAIWMSGMLFGLSFRIKQYWKLRTILKGNILVEDPQCEVLIVWYKDKYGLKKIEFYQNDMVTFPMTTGSFRKKIILPIKDYTEKELYMILEHEINHVKSYDLLWKKIGLFITFIHWWNPFSYILLRKLILQLEIECDIKTCENNDHFSMKEYGYYLAGMEEEKNDLIFLSALSKPKKGIIRRLEGMVNGKKCKKWMVAVSCTVLVVAASIPSYAAAEGFARMNEEWISETEVEVEVPMMIPLLEMTSHVDFDEVVEIDVSDEVECQVFRSSTAVDLNRSINGNTRVVYATRTMQAGNKVTFTASCSDSSIVYRVGIRDQAGNLTYVQGSGNITHTFTIPSNGSYAAYVENRSSKTMKVTGNVSYIY